MANNKDNLVVGLDVGTTKICAIVGNMTRDGLEIVGDLTIRGVTNPVALEVEFDGTSKDPWGGTRAGFSAETEINRKDWGMEWNTPLEAGGVMLGDKVKIEIDVQLVKS